jgi:hypothetical protein
MPLTRHLYELDEVTAALQLCLHRGGVRAAFWTWELLVSDEAPMALDTIRQTWLLWGGGHDPAILTAEPPTTASGWLQLLDRTAAAITAAGSLTAEKLLARAQTYVPAPLETAQIRHHAVAAAFAKAVADDECPQAAAFWTALNTAITSRPPNRTAALWLLQAGSERLCADNLWTGLQMIAASIIPSAAATVAAIRKAATPHPESQLLHQTAAVLFLVQQQQQQQTIDTKSPPTRPSAIALRDWESWDALVDNPRAARIHAIPVDALHAGTTRGSMSAKYTNDADIHNPVALLPIGCRWWRAQAAAAGLKSDPVTEEVRWVSEDEDAAIEAFYARHFPPHVDIPDEWSAADRAKSHGRGLQETAPPPPSVPALEESVDDDIWLTGITVTLKQPVAPGHC